MILKANCTQNTYYYHLVKIYTVSKQVVVTAFSKVCGTTSYQCAHLFFNMWRHKHNCFWNTILIMQSKM